MEDVGDITGEEDANEQSKEVVETEAVVDFRGADITTRTLPTVDESSFLDAKEAFVDGVKCIDGVGLKNRRRQEK